ncbi:LysR family transcriptional regulator, partial [Burkholderia contaminans]
PWQATLAPYGRALKFEGGANGFGIGLMPLPLVEGSPLRDALDIVPLADFKPQIDLWLLRRHDAARFDAPLAAVAAHARTAFALPEQAHGKAAA